MSHPIELTRRVTALIGVALILYTAAVDYRQVQADEGPTSNAPIRIVAPHRLPADDIDAQRTPLGVPNDYKPWIARLANGELLIVGFCYGGVPSNELAAGEPYIERAVFWRSDDGGRTWGSREERNDIRGREFSLNCLSDGTLLMPCHFLGNDAANRDGYTYSKLFRSGDHGHSWGEIRIGPDGFPPKANTATDWTVIEMPNSDAAGQSCVLFGVSMQHGGEKAGASVRLWQSRNSGQTWDRSLNPDTDGWSDVDGFFSQSTTHRCTSGKLLHAIRVDRTGPHWKLPSTSGIKVEAGDQGDRMMLWESTDEGRTWRRHGQDGRFGTYGEMYPRFLKLQDGRLLLTFTVRSNSTDGHSLGLRATISSDDGETWDFRRDRIVIDAQNHGASGGGFGNTIQIDDGTLITCYSYRGVDGKTHIEAARWRLPASLPTP